MWKIAKNIKISIELENNAWLKVRSGMIQISHQTLKVCAKPIYGKIVMEDGQLTIDGFEQMISNHSSSKAIYVYSKENQLQTVWSKVNLEIVTS